MSLTEIVQATLYDWVRINHFPQSLLDMVGDGIMQYVSDYAKDWLICLDPSWLAMVGIIVTPGRFKAWVSRGCPPGCYFEG